MIVPDVNLLLYAYDRTAPHHARALRWWSQCMDGTEIVGISALTVLAFVRLSTQSRFFDNAYSVQEAWGVVGAWLRRPIVDRLDLEFADLEYAARLLSGIGEGGNLTTDAALAAQAIRWGAVIHSADRDFERFRQVAWYNPLTNRSTEA